MDGWRALVFQRDEKQAACTHLLTWRGMLGDYGDYRCQWCGCQAVYAPEEHLDGIMDALAAHPEVRSMRQVKGQGN